MASTKSYTKVRVTHTCPKCRADLDRISRTSFDKVIAMLLPVRRYKCMNCLWEGLRVYQSYN